jgi:hypothetical protein
VLFIESKVFTRKLHAEAGRLADSVLSAIQNELVEYPARGDVVRGLGGIRKARTSDPSRGKGKRGGYRYLFLYLEHRSHIHLLYMFGKNEQEDLSDDERAQLRRLVTRIRTEMETTHGKKKKDVR